MAPARRHEPRQSPQVRAPAPPPAAPAPPPADGHEGPREPEPDLRRDHVPLPHNREVEVREPAVPEHRPERPRHHRGRVELRGRFREVLARHGAVALEAVPRPPVVVPGARRARPGPRPGEPRPTVTPEARGADGERRSAGAVRGLPSPRPSARRRPKGGRGEPGWGSAANDGWSSEPERGGGAGVTKGAMAAPAVEF